MPLKSPKFWYQPNSVLGYIFEPLSWFYQIGAALHQKLVQPYRPSIPVISVGNLVLGGAGKTPMTIALAQKLQTMGRTPHIISRGYGGTLQGPIQVAREIHTYHQVGDEPLLLAKVAPTWVSKNRRAAVDLAIGEGADILLLDDGHQNYSLEKDICIVVISSIQGLGNGRVFPAGPLREPLENGLKKTTTLVCIGPENQELPVSLRHVHCPVIRAFMNPLNPQPCEVIAFTGIGHPEKFRQTLLEAGYQVKEFIPFPDHYPYLDEDIHALQRKAESARVPLITTEKDFVRLPPLYRSRVLTLPVSLKFQQNDKLEELLKPFT